MKWVWRTTGNLVLLPWLWWGMLPDSISAKHHFFVEDDALVGLEPWRRSHFSMSTSNLIRFSPQQATQKWHNLATLPGNAGRPFLMPNSAAFIPAFPTFNSQRLDQQIQLYANYLATSGVPDVLIIGSSRSLQGVDPVALQRALADRGHPDLKIYNFGINGATARVVDLILRQILTPDQLPQLIVWADGSRAFNSGRADITYNGIAASDGYKRLATGARPIRFGSQRQYQLTPNEVCIDLPRDAQIVSTMRSFCRLPPAAMRHIDRSSVTSSLHRPITDDLDFTGFQSVSTRFNPATYYQQFPRVSGRYDTNYIPFRLEGEQTAAAIAVAALARTQGIPLIFVNLPLTREYLDPVRHGYEQQFRQYMQRLATRERFAFRDLMGQWSTQNDYFADPSHLNRDGARAVAQWLAADDTLSWPRPRTSELLNGNAYSVDGKDGNN